MTILRVRHSTPRRSTTSMYTPMFLTLRHAAEILDFATTIGLPSCIQHAGSLSCFFVLSLTTIADTWVFHHVYSILIVSNLIILGFVK